ncbi:MAG TPA: TrmH family RNA methyltransferase [Candidatus Gracilibacteria bacterium]|nr:TrmH family RNA methyltransferase [Candidatus Gracilibacteria bacterium]
MIYFLLDNIRSRFNVGAIFRSAEFFAIDRIILTGFTPLPDSIEVSKTAIGAEKRVDWQYYEDPILAVQDLKQKGFYCLAAEINPRASSLYNFCAQSKRDYLVVLGNEIQGVNPEIEKLMDEVLMIPKCGDLKESLNVEVSAGIFMSYLRQGK